MNWKKFLIFGAVCSSMITPALTQAYYQNDCCYTDECCEDGWGIYADWLFWNTRSCKLDYAIPYNDDSIGKVYGVEPGYDSGFRIGAYKSCNCWDYGIDYTFYRTSASDKIEKSDGHIAGTQLLDDYVSVSQGDIYFAKSDWNLDYDVIRLSMGRGWDVNNCFTVNFFGGLKFAYISQEFNNFYASSVDLDNADKDLVKQRIDMDGYGLGFGFAPEYQVGQCFSLFGSFSYDALVSRFDRTFKYFTADSSESEYETDVDLKDKCWNSVSVFHLAVGLKFFRKNVCNCSDISLAIGYEFENWLNSTGFIEHQNESDEITFDRYNEGLGFDGLFIRLNALF